MGLFDFFKQNKKKSALEEIMETSDLKEIMEAMSEMAKGGCSTDEMPEGIGRFGLDVTNPIPTHTVSGSVLYLEGLRSLDDEKVNNIRLGSTGAENIENPIDIYKISHPDGSDIATIYISPYQAVNSKKAPEGLKQVSPLL